MKSLFLAIICLSALLPTSAPAQAQKSEKPMLAIVIDDFGGYDQSGVETMLEIDAPLTLAIMPDVDHTADNVEMAKAAGKEYIVHMPMQACVNFPLSWYGPDLIYMGDNKETVFSKLDKAFESVKDASGFNIHIGSGVCQSEQTMGYVYDYAKRNNLPFLDSRTHINTVAEKVASAHGLTYLGRDEFLEPEHDRSYEGVRRHLLAAASTAKEKGHAIAIGHVGSHGGQNTANAIKDSIKDIENMGVEIVSLSTLYNRISA